MTTHDLRHFMEWWPEPLPDDLTVDIMPLPQGVKFPECASRCILSHLSDGEHAIIFAAQGYGMTQDEADYDSYKRAAYFWFHRVIPPPTFIVEQDDEPLPALNYDGYDIHPEAE